MPENTQVTQFNAMHVDSHVILTGLLLTFPGHTDAEYGAMVNLSPRSVRRHRREMADRASCLSRDLPTGFKSREGEMDAFELEGVAD